jgi:hypothetical protein
MSTCSPYTISRPSIHVRQGMMLEREKNVSMLQVCKSLKMRRLYMLMVYIRRNQEGFLFFKKPAANVGRSDA